MLVTRTHNRRCVGFTFARSALDLMLVWRAESNRPPTGMAVPGGDAVKRKLSSKYLAMSRPSLPPSPDGDRGRSRWRNGSGRSSFQTENEVRLRLLRPAQERRLRFRLGLALPVQAPPVRAQLQPKPCGLCSATPMRRSRPPWPHSVLPSLPVCTTSWGARYSALL